MAPCQARKGNGMGDGEKVTQRGKTGNRLVTDGSGLQSLTIYI